MKIAIIGYGKMGQAIEEVIKKTTNHKIILISNTLLKCTNYCELDLIIEFSSPNLVINNIKFCLKNRIPLICGTTGWNNNNNKLLKYIHNINKTKILISPNFNILINLLFNINKKINKIFKILNYNSYYNINIEEIHHKQKIDSPSGTTLKIINDILEKKNKKKWLYYKKNKKKDTIYINSKRINKNIGTHKILYKSIIDEIIIKHVSKNRLSFIIGIILSINWIKKIKKNGIFTFEDVINDII